MPIQSLPASQAPTGALLARLSGSAPIETPISAVFVGTDTAWKLHRAVCLPFVDFTDLSTREHAARRELELNQVWAPSLYRDVVAVTDGADGPELGGAGTVLDYVVRMARVQDSDFLLTRAANGGLTDALLDELGDLVASMHESLEPLHDTDPMALERVTDGNVATALASGLPQDRVQKWHDDVRARLAELHNWSLSRIANGFVRRCHGDLHLGNLCLFEGRVTPFDALEFNEDMAITDQGYDLAFLLMDLDIRVGRPAANRVLNRYLARRPDVDLLRGMPVFLSLRALVRAHVAANGGKNWQPYMDYAEAVLRAAPASAIGIGGLPGTGKSTIARVLAPGVGAAPGAVILRSDEIRKRLHNVAPEQRLPESAYTPEISHQVMRILFTDMQRAIDAGHAVIADLTFMSLEHRRQANAAARLAPFAGIWLTAPLAVLQARVEARRGDASDATQAVLNRLAAADPGAGDWIAIDTNAPDVVQRIAAAIRNFGISC
jgi:aminoglycoside phosphotransferase family enzyme/predicted kinase